MSPEREKSQAEKDGHQPKRGETEQEKYPASQMGTNGTKEIMGLCRPARFEPEEGISRVIGEEAYPHNQGNEEKNDTPYFLLDGFYVLFCFGFVFRLFTQLDSDLTSKWQKIFPFSAWA
jgi:hypothetical protein